MSSPAAADPARPATPVVLAARRWTALAREHTARADALSAGHRHRRSTGTTHPVEDFLWTYYPTRPALLARWHPGVGVHLAPDDDGPAPHATWRWYATADDGTVGLDLAGYATDRADTARFVHRLLTATASRPPHLGCFGLHEWAMVYREPEHRHPLPLRLGGRGTDEVVESHPLRCTHFDAFRFFTPSAVPRNRWRPTREAQVDLEQPGCLHAGMDCHKWAMKLGPAVPGDLALDCFELARDIRVLDMRASPYDLSSYGLAPVAVETATGKAEYTCLQRGFADRAAVLRERLVAVCEAVLAAAPTGVRPG